MFWEGWAGVRVNFLVVIVIIVTRWHPECGATAWDATPATVPSPESLGTGVINNYWWGSLSSLLSQSGSFVRFMETFKCGYFVLQFWWQSCVHSNEFTINLTSCNIATSLISRSLFASWYHHHHHYFKSLTKAKILTPVRTLPKKCLMFEIDRSTVHRAMSHLMRPSVLIWPGVKMHSSAAPGPWAGQAPGARVVISLDLRPRLPWEQTPSPRRLASWARAGQKPIHIHIPTISCVCNYHQQTSSAQGSHIAKPVGRPET